MFEYEVSIYNIIFLYLFRECQLMNQFFVLENWKLVKAQNYIVQEYNAMRRKRNLIGEYF